MKSVLRTIDDHGRIYQALMFVCPGCKAGVASGDYDGIHMLPVNVEPPIDKPSWKWNGDLDRPTLEPSILTYEDTVHPRCHSFLRDGVFEFLSDSTHPLSGQSVPIPDLPDWATKEGEAT